MGRHKVAGKHGKLRERKFGGRRSNALIYTEYHQTAMAKYVGVGVGYLGRVLSGKTRPSIGKAQLFAKYLGVSLEEFVRKSDWAIKTQGVIQAKEQQAR